MNFFPAEIVLEYELKVEKNSAVSFVSGLVRLEKVPVSVTWSLG